MLVEARRSTLPRFDENSAITIDDSAQSTQHAPRGLIRLIFSAEYGFEVVVFRDTP